MEWREVPLQLHLVPLMSKLREHALSDLFLKVQLGIGMRCRSHTIVHKCNLSRVFQQDIAADGLLSCNMLKDKGIHRTHRSAGAFMQVMMLQC